jgi:hypothetical protein
MNCKESKLISTLYLAGESNIAVEVRSAFKAHLRECPKCAGEFEVSRKVIDLVKRCWKPEHNLASTESARFRAVQSSMTIERGWKDLMRTCPDLAQQVKRRRNQRLFSGAGAAAACLVAALTWALLSQDAKTRILPVESSNVAGTSSSPVTVELITAAGNIAIPGDQKIVAGDELKMLRINNRHWLMLNKATSLLVWPLTADSHIGCIVRLDYGEVCAHVEHDGNPFVVETAHGRAVITGTTFDVKAETDGTILVVSEGTVRFESDNDAVNVTAGRRSRIAAKSAPTQPAECNPKEFMAWATANDADNIAAKSDIAAIGRKTTDLPLCLTSQTMDLERVDYDRWIEDHREWFKRQFPWIFELKEALAKEGIDVDYPTLLIKTGDIRQFVFSNLCPVAFSKPDIRSLLGAASFYGMNEDWLIKNIPIAKSNSQTPAPRDVTTRLNYFDCWIEYAAGPENSSVCFFTSAACQYLAETRTLMWLAVKNGQFNLTAAQRNEVLGLLNREINAAWNCQNNMLYASDESKISPCNKNNCDISNATIQFIESIKTAEEKIAVFENRW